MRTQPHSNAKRFIKSCRKRLQHVPRVGAEKDNYQQKGPVKTKKLTVGIFYIFHTLAVIALSFLKLLIKIKWKNIKKIPTVSFKIQVFGTELDSWWRLKSSLLRRALKIVSPCRAFCIVLFSICVYDQTKTGEETPFASLSYAQPIDFKFIDRIGNILNLLIVEKKLTNSILVALVRIFHTRIQFIEISAR